MNNEEKTKSITAHGLISEALGLQASYFVLENESKQVLASHIERKTLILAGLKQSSSLILSFATEIALKALLKFRFNLFPKIHDLEGLFNKLSSEDKLQLSIIFNSKTNLNIHEFLEKNKNSFMEFRYFEGQINQPFDNMNLNEALDAIIIYYNQLLQESKN